MASVHGKLIYIIEIGHGVLFPFRNEKNVFFYLGMNMVKDVMGNLDKTDE